MSTLSKWGGHLHVYAHTRLTWNLSAFLVLAYTPRQ